MNPSRWIAAKEVYANKDSEIFEKSINSDNSSSMVNLLEKSSKLSGGRKMKYTSVVISVANIHAAQTFYKGLFGLEVSQG